MVILRATLATSIGLPTMHRTPVDRATLMPVTTHFPTFITRPPTILITEYVSKVVLVTTTDSSLPSTATSME